MSERLIPAIETWAQLYNVWRFWWLSLLCLANAPQRVTHIPSRVLPARIRGTQFKFIDKPAVKFYNDHTHLLTFTVPGNRHLKDETSRDRTGSSYPFEHLSSIKRF